MHLSDRFEKSYTQCTSHIFSYVSMKFLCDYFLSKESRLEVFMIFSAKERSTNGKKAKSHNLRYLVMELAFTC